jgi:hypothetical protein
MSARARREASSRDRVAGTFVVLREAKKRKELERIDDWRKRKTEEPLTVLVAVTGGWHWQIRSIAGQWTDSEQEPLEGERWS